ncbi:helix-turn-helix domain-containing protein [Providencia rettgeri]|uniref:helix-turn-helix domain-containing protein n=1 Tax=Providencia huaxiensis TaxID=2027290 RepID=UPI0034E38CC8
MFFHPKIRKVTTCDFSQRCDKEQTNNFYRHKKPFKIEPINFTFKLESRNSLAAMLGVSVRQLNRTLIKLVEGKLIELKGKKIKIINLEKIN